MGRFRWAQNWIVGKKFSKGKKALLCNLRNMLHKCHESMRYNFSGADGKTASDLDTLGIDKMSVDEVNKFSDKKKAQRLKALQKGDILTLTKDKADNKDTTKQKHAELVVRHLSEGPWGWSKKDFREKANFKAVKTFAKCDKTHLNKAIEGAFPNSSSSSQAKSTPLT